MPAENDKTGEMAPRRKSRLVLDFDPYTFALNVDGDAVSLEETLTMLAIATRAVEDQRRLAMLQDVQAHAAENARVSRLLQSVNRGN